ncbi:MAG: transporter related protein [Bacteroidetes bacterium]|nr:transporter related protein [Bacteroidota bacterium]
MSIVETSHLSIGYLKGKSRTLVQSDLNLELNNGEMVCLIGPNGSGKTTLLRTLAGLQKPLRGDVKIKNKLISELSQQEKALEIALVLTDKVQIENATVRDIVTLGQLPYTHWLGGLTDEGREKVDEAISMVHLKQKANYYLNELSDGERQRVMIAKALAQDTPLIFLDEPTAHLDLPNRVEIMLLLHRLAHKTQKSIILSTHELDLALQAADRIWLMSETDGVICGVPEDLVIDGSFNRIFQSEVYYFNATNGNFSMNYPLTKELSLSGDKTRLYWTLRALARSGFYVTANARTHINITEKGWEVNGEISPTIEDLLLKLATFTEI